MDEHLFSFKFLFPSRWWHCSINFHLLFSRSFWITYCIHVCVSMLIQISSYVISCGSFLCVSDNLDLDENMYINFSGRSTVFRNSIMWNEPMFTFQPTELPTWNRKFSLFQPGNLEHKVSIYLLTVFFCFLQFIYWLETVKRLFIYIHKNRV